MRFPVVLHTDDGVRFGVTASALGPVASCGVEAVSFAVIAVSLVLVGAGSGAATRSNACASSPVEAANLRVRAELMEKISTLLEESGWTQTEAASHCGVTQPRINDLLRDRISRFSVDALVNIAAALDRRVHVELEVV